MRHAGRCLDPCACAATAAREGMPATTRDSASTAGERQGVMVNRIAAPCPRSPPGTPPRCRCDSLRARARRSIQAVPSFISARISRYRVLAAASTDSGVAWSATCLRAQRVSESTSLRTPESGALGEHPRVPLLVREDRFRPAPVAAQMFGDADARGFETGRSFDPVHAQSALVSKAALPDPDVHIPPDRGPDDPQGMVPGSGAGAGAGPQPQLLRWRVFEPARRLVARGQQDERRRTPFAGLAAGDASTARRTAT